MIVFHRDGYCLLTWQQQIEQEVGDGAQTMVVVVVVVVYGHAPIG